MRPETEARVEAVRRQAILAKNTYTRPPSSWQHGGHFFIGTMKLAFLEFMLSGPGDAIHSGEWGTVISKAHLMRLRVYHEKGSIKSAHWVTFSGRPHNPFGPSCIWFHPCGKPRVIEYHIDGCTHRAIGPAIIEYDERGNVLREQYITSSFVQEYIY